MKRNGKKLLSLALALCMLLSLAPAALAEEALPPEDPAPEAAAEAPAEAEEPDVPQDDPAEAPAEIAELDVPQEEPAEEPDVPQDDPADEPVRDGVSPAGTSFASPDVPESEPAEEPTEEPDDADEEESVSTEAAEITVAPSDEPPENGWYNDGEHTYYYVNGEYYYDYDSYNYHGSGIHRIDGSFYYFDENGWMMDDAEKYVDRGYIRAHAGGELYADEWYKIIDSSGKTHWYFYGCKDDFQLPYYHIFRASGLTVLDGYEYFFNPYLITDTIRTIDGYSYVIDENGRAAILRRNGWTKAFGYWYYCIDGEYLYGHVREIDGDWYGFDGYGKMYVNQFFSSHEAGSSVSGFFYAGADGKLAANKWVLNGPYWNYYGPNRRSYKSGTYTIDGKRYTFNELGMCTNRKVGTGWVKVDGQWHYIYQNGGSAYEWAKIDGKWYYFNVYVMVTGKQRINGKTYYFSDSGVMLANKWMQEDGKWLYLNGSGALSTGWQKIGGTWYYFENDGAMVTGRKTIDGKSYVFADSGAMAANKWLEESDGWHYRDGNGHEVTGWYKVSSKWYYFDGNGVMLTGKQEIGGKLYFFADSGVMQAGKWIQDGADWYYLGSGGDAYRNQWFKSGGKWYYFDENCVMLADTSREIKGKTYHFNASGVCTNP